MSEMDKMKRIFPAGWVEVDFSVASMGIFFDNPTPDWRRIDRQCSSFGFISPEAAVLYRQLTLDKLYLNLPDYDLPFRNYHQEYLPYRWQSQWHQSLWEDTPVLYVSIYGYPKLAIRCTGEVIGEE